MHFLHSSIVRLGDCASAAFSYILVTTQAVQTARYKLDEREAMTVLTFTGFDGATFGQRIAALRATFADKLAKRKIYNATFKELQSLTDRDLNDLGMSRSMIKGIALEAAYDK